jgi:hypothetical protein
MPQHSEHTVSSISRFQVSGSMKLIDEAESVCVAVCLRGLDEAFVKVFNVRCLNVVVLPHVMELGEILAHAM